MPTVIPVCGANPFPLTVVVLPSRSDVPAELVTGPMTAVDVGTVDGSAGAGHASARTAADGWLGSERRPATVLLATTVAVYVRPGVTPVMTHDVVPTGTVHGPLDGPPVGVIV